MWKNRRVINPTYSVSKESVCSAGDLGTIPGERNGSPLQDPCLENLMDREAWWAAVVGLQRVGHS